MPLKRCNLGKSKGWKWGDSGKCYRSKRDALRQGAAIEISKHKRGISQFFSHFFDKIDFVDAIIKSCLDMNDAQIDELFDDGNLKIVDSDNKFVAGKADAEREVKLFYPLEQIENICEWPINEN